MNEFEQAMKEHKNILDKLVNDEVTKVIATSTASDNPDFSEVINMAKEYFINRVMDGNFDRDDTEVYIFEGVLEAIYGKDIFTKLQLVDKLKRMSL